ncbi:MAG: hypothetical protein IT244_06410 [Bacteroidia bacterium]|nr:hypothetical protein [Bacteroidia bacterium]
MIFKKFWSYITFQKQDGPKNSNVRLMHGINRISILMFLFAIVVMVVRCLR